MAASKYIFENIFNMNDLRAMLRRVSLFVFTYFLSLNFHNIVYYLSVYHKIGIDLCKVLLKTVRTILVSE